MRLGHTGIKWRTVALAPFLLAVSAAAPAAGPAAGAPDPERCAAHAASSEEQSPRADCCFTNRAFTGVCRVRPAEDETCATILAYLNNPQSQGKAYCGGTTIRSGWQQVSCETPPASGPVEGSEEPGR
jgi:hypothetical protein